MICLYFLLLRQNTARAEQEEQERLAEYQREQEAYRAKYEAGISEGKHEKTGYVTHE